MEEAAPVASEEASHYLRQEARLRLIAKDRARMRRFVESGSMPPAERSAGEAGAIDDPNVVEVAALPVRDQGPKGR